LTVLLTSAPWIAVRGGEDVATSKKVDALFDGIAGNMPGVAVLVTQKGEEVYKKEFGLADIASGRRIGPKTSFRLASVSKQFTAMAIMILAERERLDYDDPLPLFFPDRRFPAGAERITVRALLQHTSGLPEYIDLLIDRKLISENWPRSSATLPDAFEPDSRRIFDLLRGQRVLKFPPGAAYAYSNSGYVVLGRIIEEVSGKSYGAFLEQEIFKPLGMTRTVVSDGKAPRVRNRAVSYAKDGAAYREIDYTPLNAVFGDDGVYTTIDDMKKWADALDRGALVGRAALRRAFRRGRLNSGEPTDYGFGWVLGRRRNERVIWHNGEWIGFRTYIARYPGRALTVVVLANCRETDADDLGAKVADVYLDD
jgi:CubicO group peptidase (beta-lactamase class C family)